MLKEQKILKLKQRILHKLTESKEFNEGFDDEDIPDLKYYAFDWDDNIVHMPTKILAQTIDGDVIGMSTEDFEIHKDKIGKEPVNYKGTTIVKFPENFLINFGEERQNKFVPEAMKAKPAPAFDDFREAINGGSIFAIITARGLNPNIIKRAVYEYINSGFNGINKSSLISNLKKYKKIVGDSTDKDDDELVKEYLNLCRFYPVTFRHPMGPNVNIGEEKNIKLEEFKEYVNKLSKILKMSYEIVDDINYTEFLDKQPTIGMSDDSHKNIEALIKRFGDDPRINIYSTSGGEKRRVT